MSGRAQTKQHWLPASVLGGFSVDCARRSLRDRPLHVLRRGHADPFVTSAENLAFQVGLYDMVGGESPVIDLPVDTLDATWAGYERRLPTVFKQLAVSTPLFSFEIWLKVIVPYVAGLVVRPPGYGHSLGSGQIQMSRWMEMTRIIAPLIAAEWSLMLAPADVPLIINDLGYASATDGTRDNGLIIPLLPSCALRVMPRRETPVVFAAQIDGAWATLIPRFEMETSDARSLNEHLAGEASAWVAGGRAQDVRSHVFRPPAPHRFPIGGLSWPDIGPLGAHDRDWAAALGSAGIEVKPTDWSPFGIFSDMSSGIKLGVSQHGPILAIHFD